MGTNDQTTPLLSVASLHALLYCERLFYLEEVERIRLADDRVYAGRRLHVNLEADEDELQRRSWQNEALGLQGSADMRRRRDGSLVIYEHKRGRAAGSPKHREAWPSDTIQVAAYAMLLEADGGEPVAEGRVRYHADRVTVRVPITNPLRKDVRRSIERARELSRATQRPPIAANEKLCVRCSLAPVCLPEETRAAADPKHRPVRLFPAHPRGKTIHVLSAGAQVRRRGDELLVQRRDEDRTTTRYPIAEVGSVVLHGLTQITTQAIRLCRSNSISVHWVTMGGAHTASLAPATSSAQRQIRQFEGLSDPQRCLALARRLVMAKVENQLRLVLRATRSRTRDLKLKLAITTMREMLSRASRAERIAQLLGFEGNAARAYFGTLPGIIDPNHTQFIPRGRSSHPPKDRFNALLSYAYGMLYRETVSAILTVGLHPGFGFLHQPRSSAQTLALDIMELFRVPLGDMPVIAAVNRGQFDAKADFFLHDEVVQLNASGRKKLIAVIERRRHDRWRHPVLGYSLSYARLIEVEVRLLEKEWSGEADLFARMRLR